jgi:hypothetical protein
MTRLPNAKHATALLCLALLALGLAACGATVSTSGFKGEQHAIAQTISDFQADATASDEKKICANDLAAAVVARLGATKRCERAIKDQLAEIDNLEAKVESIQLGPGAATASARVKSTHAGKRRVSTVVLVKEGSNWKISALK